MDSVSGVGGEGSKGSRFAELFSKSGGSFDKIRPGRVLTGRVSDVGTEVVSVDVGYKSDGVVPIGQFYDADGNLNVKVGDTVSVLLMSFEDEHGQVVLSKEKADQLKIWKDIEQSFTSGRLIKGSVVGKVKGGLLVDIGIPAFLPGSQIDIKAQRNLDRFIGEQGEYKILKITKENGNIVISRRAVLEQERDTLKAETLKLISEGVVVEGTVKNLTEYGAFVDLGGIDGLLHVNDISWGRVGHPSEKLSVGQKIAVVVIKYDTEGQKISLGAKQLKPDPWLTVGQRYTLGTRVKGRVSGFSDFGAFVELEEGVEGRLHLSDMSWTKKIRHPSKLVSVGDMVDVMILAIDVEGRKVNVGLKQCNPNPWEEFKVQYPLGTVVDGVITSVADFGLFVRIGDVLEGLVPLSEVSWTKTYKNTKDLAADFKKDDKVSVKILEIAEDKGNLKLGIKQTSKDPWEDVPRRFPSRSVVSGKVVSFNDYGVVVAIDEGVEGFLPAGETGLERGKELKDAFPIDSTIEAMVINVDALRRRLSLSIKAQRSKADRERISSFNNDEASGGFTLGDLMQQAGIGDKK